MSLILKSEKEASTDFLEMSEVERFKDREILLNQNDTISYLRPQKKKLTATSEKWPLSRISGSGAAPGEKQRGEDMLLYFSVNFLVLSEVKLFILGFLPFGASCRQQLANNSPANANNILSFSPSINLLNPRQL